MNSLGCATHLGTCASLPPCTFDRHRQGDRGSLGVGITVWVPGFDWEGIDIKISLLSGAWLRVYVSLNMGVGGAAAAAKQQVS